MKVKDKKRKTGFYWVRLKNGVKIVAKWWQTYDWWTQMESIHEADNNRNPIVHVYEKMLMPPEDAKPKIKRTRTRQPIPKPIKRKRRRR